MHASWKLWLDAWRMGLDAQQVIAMRLVRISTGGSMADAESRRMVSEKIAAVTAAQIAAATALASGKGIEAAASAALAPVKRAVRANHRRLSRPKGSMT
jgi:5-carboxymethyl-2-hydroxymuconate isomerase